MSKIVRVAVGIIIEPAQCAELVISKSTQFFLTKRLAKAHQGNKWEFPGGKLENNETIAQTLVRELKEEVAIEVLSCQPLLEIKHDYGDKQVCLEVFIVGHYVGKPCAQEGQQQGWFTFSQLSELDFPRANLAILEKLEQMLTAT